MLMSSSFRKLSKFRRENVKIIVRKICESFEKKKASAVVAEGGGDCSVAVAALTPPLPILPLPSLGTAPSPTTLPYPINIINGSSFGVAFLLFHQYSPHQ